MNILSLKELERIAFTEDWTLPNGVKFYTLFDPEKFQYPVTPTFATEALARERHSNAAVNEMLKYYESTLFKDIDKYTPSDVVRLVEIVKNLSDRLHILKEELGKIYEESGLKLEKNEY